MSSRQSELFAGESWTVLYRAFSQINFNASDPASVNGALRDYIRTNYPEDFNDWIESSEFVAILDLLAWLSGNLAFKTDIAARENFLETAESRDSILRLARFLSYNPSRNRPAQGIVKLVEVATDDDVIDSFGVNLANTPIGWNNPDDANWHERFVLVLNNALIPTNPFGIPLKAGTVSSVVTQLYRLNALASASNLGFTATVAGASTAFEAVNGSFTDGGSLYEQAPNPLAALHLYYLNDANGNASPRTGFFLLFKQGSTQQTTFAISNPVENQLLDIGSTGINQDDVWVQTVADDASVITDWIKVPAVLNSNITYNTLPASERNIFAALTRDQDQVSLRFSDGRFGNAPVGNIKATYRVSNGLAYTIKPQEIERVTLSVPYANRFGAKRTLRLTFSLFEPVSNAAPRETEQQIAVRAPQVYATQNRMVSGEDYNTFPLSTNLALKIKAVNRVYSGQSRYYDLSDPTGTYQDLTLFSDDGAFFATAADSYNEIVLDRNLTPAQLIGSAIQPAVQSARMANVARDFFLRASLTSDLPPPLNLIWTQSQASLTSATGWFNQTNALLLPGAELAYAGPARRQWAGVAAIEGSPNVAPPPLTAGPVTLTVALANQTPILAILPRFQTTLPAAILSLLDDKLNKRLSFSLWYDFNKPGTEWSVQAPNPLGTVIAGSSGTALQLMSVDYLSRLWRISARGLRYVFESERSVKFYDDGARAVDQQTGAAVNDSLTLLRINGDPDAPQNPFRDFILDTDQTYTYANGSPEPKRIDVVYPGASAGFADDPDLFQRVTSAVPANRFLFWSVDSDGIRQRRDYGVWVYQTEAARLSASVPPPLGTTAFQIEGGATRSRTFWSLTTTGWVQDFSDAHAYAEGRGPNVASVWINTDGTLAVPPPQGSNLAFQWKHYAPSDHRIDPASTNIHDIFVLTYSYDAAVRQWIKNGAVPASLPLPPNELDLRLAFAGLEDFRMYSDALVWRPVRYKFLFGTGARDVLRASFKIVRLINTTVSDGEIKTRVIATINDYFAVAKWDFGETFYFTELAAYVHQQMAGIIASFVIVPLSSGAAFGADFEIPSRADEIFVSTAQVSDVTLIDSNTPSNLRMKL